ncbi:MAG: zinc ribbon domain-containing protein [Bryobacteraceae bacterium]|nr:zinc ribbon domain-containing protein [Bryobacteraceae bacterium]
MPMYEYRCEECGRLYEQLRRMSDADADLTCPHCGSTQVKRQWSSCAISGGSSAQAGGGNCGGGGGFS